MYCVFSQCLKFETYGSTFIKYIRLKLLFQRPSDSERLLQRSLRNAEEGHELEDDFASPPAWIDKLEEAQYTISK